MKKIIYITIILFFFGIACTNSNKPKTIKQTVQKTTVKKKKTTSIKKQRIFPLTNGTYKKYLLEYGQKNLETKGIISTKFGDIHFKLYKNTPLHRANFILLVKEGYFDKTVFQRVVYEFIIQGGSDDTWDISKLRKHYGRYLIEPEFKNKHRFGAISMARQWEGNPNKLSDPYEFYIVVNKNGTHHLDNEHTVFAQVTKGFNVLRKIERVQVDKREWPIDDIDIKIRVY